ncbi:hypothetical protein ACTXT7_016968, partial [Hymenolepis weldensis]
MEVGNSQNQNLKKLGFMIWAQGYIIFKAALTKDCFGAYLSMENAKIPAVQNLW